MDCHADTVIHRKGGQDMPCSLIAEVKITDDAWVPDYAAQVHDIVARHGGRYLSRSGKIETLEGEGPDASLVALIEFPSRDAAMAFAQSPEYAPFGAARKAGSVSNFYLIDDSDAAGTIPYLNKG